MKEELEEGHFDKSGHYQWNKETDIRDDWLDTIDWVKIKHQPGNSSGESSRKRKHNETEEEDVTVESLSKTFDVRETYSKMLAIMKPGETVKQTLIRLGKGQKKLTSVERLRMKKSGIVDSGTQAVTEFSELSNEILQKTGNTDIYEESYATVSRKSKSVQEGKGAAGEELDMYADDFGTKEKEKKVNFAEPDPDENKVEWEFKWKQEDEKVHGPFTTEQMQNWVEDDYFKSGVYVRKIGDDKFYSSSRIDFELYL